jgi:hydroxymethylbilane synthase
LLDGFAVHALPFDVMLPAPGQGALALEIRAENASVTERAARISDPPTVAATTAERALLEALGGGCQLPLGSYAEILGDTLRLRAILLSPDGTQASRSDRTGPASAPSALARLAAEELRAHGIPA